MTITAEKISIHIEPEYKSLIKDLKTRVHSAQLKAAVAVNHELVQLYWYIGNQILTMQAENKWGTKLVRALSIDLRNTFPETKGFSVSNLYFMRQFAEYYDEGSIVQQAVGQLPWSHIITLIQKVKSKSERAWYATETIKNRWSRRHLESNIKESLYRRQGINQTKVSNYLERLEAPQAELAQEILKSPYNFDFLGLHDQAYERDIEHASIQHITRFLLELGSGFAFIGSQVPVEIDGEEFFIDMLFYNVKLRCYFVVEIKATKFKPEHTGQLNFYLNAVDSLFRHKHDGPSVGLLLCKSRSKVIAEYALQGIEKPIGISEYELTRAIPENLKGSLPSIEEIEAELN